jgi:hypothetical protein
MKKCKFCKSEIDADASICKHCGSDQSRYIRVLKITGLTNIVSIMVLVFSLVQHCSTVKEKDLAQKANESAQIALHKTDSLSNRNKILTKLNAEISFIERYRSMITIDNNGVTYPKVFSKKLDSIMQIIEPDSNKRMRWKENLSNSK